jgi:hypothetical protein
MVECLLGMSRSSLDGVSGRAISNCQSNILTSMSCHLCFWSQQFWLVQCVISGSFWFAISWWLIMLIISLSAFWSFEILLLRIFRLSLYPIFFFFFFFFLEFLMYFGYYPSVGCRISTEAFQFQKVHFSVLDIRALVIGDLFKIFSPVPM